uniref:P/Homo B domain-containing protein n=1 Tax=Caenorhabditis japonica TaxID=281687 RepID=A0A8R1DJ11_CAEJA
MDESGERNASYPVALQSYDDVYIGRRYQRRRRRRRQVDDEIVSEMLLGQHVTFLEKLHGFRRFKRDSIHYKTLPIHVVGESSDGSSSKKHPYHFQWNLTPSMRIKEAWKAGFNASQVTVAVVDDGVDVGHVDLRSAFSPSVSFDFVRFAALPLPKKSEDTQHGTQCAGLVSMEGNQCGLGVGHGATLGAIRLLGPDVLNDALEGDALAFQKDMIDIYSISWGPKDDGKTADKPANFTQEAIKNGVMNGRAGRGNIFVWASGNGGQNGDNCALDGYVSNDPQLTQRDIQHLIVHSSNSSAIRHVQFLTNTAGHHFHPKVGFGLLDAHSMVTKAATWQTVGVQKSCEVHNLPSGTIDLSDCCDVSQIERVILHGTIRHPQRGSVQIRLTSPGGTTSELLPLRRADSTPDLIEWDFVSVHFFGERAKGVWKLDIISENDDNVQFRVLMKSLRVTGI